MRSLGWIAAVCPTAPSPNPRHCGLQAVARFLPVRSRQCLRCPSGWSHFPRNCQSGWRYWVRHPSHWSSPERHLSRPGEWEWMPALILCPHRRTGLHPHRSQIPSHRSLGDASVAGSPTTRDVTSSWPHRLPSSVLSPGTASGRPGAGWPEGCHPPGRVGPGRAGDRACSADGPPPRPVPGLSAWCGADPAARRRRCAHSPRIAGSQGGQCRWPECELLVGRELRLRKRCQCRVRVLRWWCLRQPRGAGAISPFDVVTREGRAVQRLRPGQQ